MVFPLAIRLLADVFVRDLSATLFCGKGMGSGMGGSKSGKRGISKGVSGGESG